MTVEEHPRPEPDALVRAAGWSLIASCGGWAVILPLLAALAAARSDRAYSLAAVLLGGTLLLLPAAVLVWCGFGVLHGSRNRTMAAIVLLSVVTVVTVLTLPMNAVLLVLLVAAHRRLPPPVYYRVSVGPAGWTRLRAAQVAGVSCLLVSAGGVTWVVTAALAGPTLFAGVSSPLSAAVYLLVAPVAVAVCAVGLLRDSRASAEAAMGLLLAFCGGSAMSVAAQWSALWWAPVNAVLLLLVLRAYLRMPTTPAPAPAA